MIYLWRSRAEVVTGTPGKDRDCRPQGGVWKPKCKNLECEWKERSN
jgi:hypothetical protein